MHKRNYKRFYANRKGAVGRKRSHLDRIMDMMAQIAVTGQPSMPR